MATRRTTAAENVAINMLADDPDLTLEEALDLVLESEVELWDPVTRTMVRPEDVARELSKLESRSSGAGRCPPGLRVYHATDLATARSLVRRGFIPETKPRPRHAGMEYAPGRGADPGLYVGESPRAVEGYGRAIVEVCIPEDWLEVPAELRAHGVRDPLRALESHDGAVINRAIPASAFQIFKG
jgi:hypothetical protein